MGRAIRLGLPALAAYALVLQVFLAGAAPAATFDIDGSPLCAELAAGAGHPTPDQPLSHHQGPCLIHCGAPTLVGLAAVDAAPQANDARFTLLAPAPDAQASSPLWRPCPGARAPPEA